jgi:hypothetical protein
VLSRREGISIGVESRITDTSTPAASKPIFDDEAAQLRLWTPRPNNRMQTTGRRLFSQIVAWRIVAHGFFAPGV